MPGPLVLWRLSNPLKQYFASASVLRHPDPQQPFFIEVDASDIGAGAILSQRQITNGKLHPCTYSSPAEQNYDIGNRERLAVKLEEWHHFLEGAPQPITIYTDHKNY